MSRFPLRRRTPSNPATEVAHVVLRFAVGAMRSKLLDSPHLAGDVYRGEAIVLAEVASVQSTIHAGTTEHPHVAESTNQQNRSHGAQNLRAINKTGYVEITQTNKYTNHPKITPDSIITYIPKSAQADAKITPESCTSLPSLSFSLLRAPRVCVTPSYHTSTDGASQRRGSHTSSAVRDWHHTVSDSHQTYGYHPS